MNRTKRFSMVSWLIPLAFLGVAAEAQPMGAVADATMTKGPPSLSAELVDPAKKAPKHTATVKLTATGVMIVDPASASEVPQPGQAHFHYQVDQGPIIATTAPTLSFHDLQPGSHTITVTLAANDHSPIGTPAVLKAIIP